MAVCLCSYLAIPRLTLCFAGMQVLTIANINGTSGINAVDFTDLNPPFLDMSMTSDNDDLYEQYLARIYYFITQLGLGNNNCSTG